MVLGTQGLQVGIRCPVTTTIDWGNVIHVTAGRNLTHGDALPAQGLSGKMGFPCAQP